MFLDNMCQQVRWPDGLGAKIIATVAALGLRRIKQAAARAFLTHTTFPLKMNIVWLTSYGVDANA
jgi:hypothetical protein